LHLFSSGSDAGCFCWERKCSEPLRPAYGLNFYQAIPNLVADASADAKQRWYMPDYGSGGGRALKDPQEGNKQADTGNNEKRGNSELDDILAGVQKDDYSLVKEESTCFDPAALVDPTIKEKDVSQYRNEELLLRVVDGCVGSCPLTEDR